MKRALTFFALLLFGIVVISAKPTSYFSLRVGPSWWGQLGLKIQGDFTLDFWVAHVESDLSFEAFATDNSIAILPASMVTYARFDWKHLLVEYGSRSYHSKSMVTCWDVGELPKGWHLKIKANGGDNSLSLSSDRGTYDLNFENSFLLLDGLWYPENTLFTFGIRSLFFSVGSVDGVRLGGIGGKIGSFSFSLLASEKDVDFFPNLKDQIPSQYVGLFRYDSETEHLLMVMTENEFYANSRLKFNFFGAKEKLWFEFEYFNVFPYIIKTSGGMEIEKRLNTNSIGFLSLSYENAPILWLGTEWRF